MMHCQEMMLASVRSASLVALDCGACNCPFISVVF
jgi:hypothetical protein